MCPATKLQGSWDPPHLFVELCWSHGPGGTTESSCPAQGLVLVPPRGGKKQVGQQVSEVICCWPGPLQSLHQRLL